MSKFGFKPTFSGFGNLKGLENAQKVAAEMVWRKPWLPFGIPGQVIVDPEGNVLFGATPADGEVRDGLVYFHFQIDPQKITPEHQNEMQAIRDQLTAATQTIEKFAAANAQMNQNGKVPKITKEQLPDKDLLMEIYEQQDRAGDTRLAAAVVVSELGTHWDYVDKDGNEPKLTLVFLRENPIVAEAMQGSLVDFLERSKKSQEAATKAKKVTATEVRPDGSTVSTGIIQTPLLTGSLGGSTAPVAQTD